MILTIQFFWMKYDGDYQVTKKKIQGIEFSRKTWRIKILQLHTWVNNTIRPTYPNLLTVRSSLFLDTRFIQQCYTFTIQIVEMRSEVLGENMGMKRSRRKGGVEYTGPLLPFSKTFSFAKSKFKAHKKNVDIISKMQHMDSRNICFVIILIRMIQ